MRVVPEMLSRPLYAANACRRIFRIFLQHRCSFSPAAVLPQHVFHDLRGLVKLRQWRMNDLNRHFRRRLSVSTGVGGDFSPRHAFFRDNMSQAGRRNPGLRPCGNRASKQSRTRRISGAVNPRYVAGFVPGKKQKKAHDLSQAFDLYGGAWATRTPDQLIKSQLLYQLS